MRDAPPVTLPAGRSPSEAWLRIGLPLGLMGAGLLLTGLWAWQAPGWRPFVGGLAWLAYGALAWRWRRPCGGLLRWDGQAWYWHADARFAPGVASQAEGRPVTPEVTLDLQRLLLLRLHPRDPPDPSRAEPQRWLWLTPAGDPGRWLALRRALYSRRSRPAQ